MTDRINPNDRDSVLFAFHEECARPTAEQIIEWVSRFPEYADDIRVHASVARAIRSLSGGERFLVSLSLALALSGLDGHEFSVDTLFIDEGFGALDTDALDVAITALETLHGRGRKVGVITHVAAMIESIPVQIKVDKLGAGSSRVRVQSAGG